MVKDSELFDAMWRWTQTAINHLSNISNDGSVIVAGGQGWACDPEGRIVRGYRHVFFHRPMIENLLYENEEWKALEEMSRNHTRMAMHCDTAVGAPYKFKRTHSAKDFCYPLLPTPYIDEQGFSLTGVEGTADRITNLINEFNDDYVTMTTVRPVLGMRVRQPMYLDDEQCFRPLTEQEKLSVLNLKIIDLFEGPPVLDTSQTDWYGFVLNERLEKFFGDSETAPQNFMERYNCRDECLEMFLSVAPVVGEFVAYHGGGHAPAPRLSSRGIFGGGETGYLAGPGGYKFLYANPGPTLTDEQSARFVNVWKLVSGTHPKNDDKAKVLRNAISRLFYAETRASSADSLLDLMIAAESIYTNPDSRGELSFQLSQNAALWHDGTNMECRDAFKKMRDAYKLRSDIVHGLKVDGDKVALAASNVRTLLKAGIAKAIDAHLSDGFPPKWEELVFPLTE